MKILKSWKQFTAAQPVTSVVLQAIAFVAIGMVIARALWVRPAASPIGSEAGEAAAPAGESTSMWTCSMHPQIRSPNPGDCPICGMDLIPVSAASGGMRTLAISPASRALMNIASTPVERKYVTHEIPMVGKVDYDETKLGFITAWAPGRLDRMYVDFTGVQVSQGDHMAYIYSPELYSVQEELIQALRYRTDRPSSTRLPSIDLVESAREKLRLLGVSNAQIAEIETQTAPTDHITINCPVGGVVIEKLKQEGDYVSTGERIYTVANLDQVWVHLDAYESDLSWIRYGQDVVISTEAYPGEEFHGRIAFIQPVLNDRTRTVKVRVNVPNPRGKLKPEMFVHAVVRPSVAAGGRVMDPSLAGKWISPMHPEIIKDGPGVCDICGMPLVPAESLGYVAPDADSEGPPLVIPYSAALVTGRRAVVYVELPTMPQGVENAVEGIGGAVEAGTLDQMRLAFAALGEVLNQPYVGGRFARNLWGNYSSRMAQLAAAGGQVQSRREAVNIFSDVEAIMTRMGEEFGAVGQPTFEGRQIVLGPRAGEYYLVSHGLQEGEFVVTQGSFKIDAEIQIQAKPSMMTPEGGGGGGHHHGGEAPKANASDEHTGHALILPPAFRNQIQTIQSVVTEIGAAVERRNADEAIASFEEFGRALGAVDESPLADHARMQWREFAMLLGNDAFEGQHAEQMAQITRLYEETQRDLGRMATQLGMMQETAGSPRIQRIAVPREFQNELAAVWERYLAVHVELAQDQFGGAKNAAASLQASAAAVDSATLTGASVQQWRQDDAKLTKLIEELQQADDIATMRTAFKPLAEEIGGLAKRFGFGEADLIYELHCPMAFQGAGAVWFQADAEIRNPYYGAKMLTCADRVDRIVQEEPELPSPHDAHRSHSSE